MTNSSRDTCAGRSGGARAGARTLTAPSPVERTAPSAYTAYAAMVLEDRGWRQMFPALPTEKGARHGLAEIFRGQAVWNPAWGDRYLEVADEIQSEAADQVILGGGVYRIVRIEQTVVMTEYGPESPKPTDQEFPAELDDRRSAGCWGVV